MLFWNLPRGVNPIEFLHLLNLDDVNTEELLVYRIDIAEKLEGSSPIICLRNDLMPRFSGQHVGKAVVDADRLNPHHARSVSGFKLQQIASPQALDVVVPDANL